MGWWCTGVHVCGGGVLVPVEQGGGLLQAREQSWRTRVVVYGRLHYTVCQCSGQGDRVRTPTACVARPLVCLVLLQEPVLGRGPSMDRGHQCVRTAVDDAVLLLNYYCRLCGGVLLLHQLGVHVV